LLNLQTTIQGIELTLITLAEISALIERLDQQLSQLSPELPRVGNGGVSADGFREMLRAYEQVFGAFEQAANAAKVLGFDPDGNFAPIAKAAHFAPNVIAAPVIKQETAAIEQVSASPAVESQDPPQVIEPVAVTVQLVVEETPAPVPTTEGDAPELEVVEGLAAHHQAPAAPRGQHIRTDSELTKPLKPIEMPAADYEVGPMICNGASILYGHGPEIKKHWPGAATAKGKLTAALPLDIWRLCIVDTHLFCAGEDSVQVLKLADLSNAATIPGKFVAQSQAANSWVGVRDDNGALSVMFKDKKGKSFMGGEKLGELPTSKLFLETAGECAFVALAEGDVFRVEGCSAEHIANAGAYVNIAGFAVDENGLYITNQSGDGAWITMLDHKGKPVLRSASLAASVSHAPMIIEDKLFLFDDKKSQVVTISLDTLQEIKRSFVDGVTSIGQMIAISDEDGGALAFIATNADERPTAVYLHSLENGATTKLCPITGTKAQLGYADGHIVVASSSAMQNLIQVFYVYGAAAVKAKAA